MIKYFLSLNILSVILFPCSVNAKQANTNNDCPDMTQYQKDERNKAIAIGCIRAFQQMTMNLLYRIMQTMWLIL